MRGKIVLAGLILSLCSFSAKAQAQSSLFRNEVYCSGIITTDDVPRQTFVITGEESNVHVTYTVGQMIYINKGADDGVKAGDEFSVVRPVVDSLREQWTKWQFDILKRMGTEWADEGRVKVVELQPKTSVAVIEYMCDMIQRGDIALPFTEQPTLPLKPLGQFDRFAPPDGKALAMVMVGKNHRNQLGDNDVVYVNLGNAQGIHVGEYFRIFRYTGTEHETAFQTPRYAFDLQYGGTPSYGFGSAPAKYDWSNTPREVIGEGIVLRTGPNASTVLITFATREIYSGDYVELE
ncbi:MAG TPA: FlgT C-terminal domain-containing protein [Candidatus Acidoferrum sp.]|jgi:hypothetical protein|nr:FlgT C-terminal domain-containing protein [Candidatus Acidoferrum sp.]